MLLCPVRGCQLHLTREDRRAVCPRGHSFDIAKSGYINLLQPQDRRSKRPGDSAEAVAARRRLHDSGVTEPLLEAISALAAPAASDVVLDEGCGEGFFLGRLASEHGFAGHGIDISIPAVDAAARRYPGCEWIVGNADRFVPYADGTFSLALSVTARMNAAELRRVLASGGRLMVAVPAPEDLVELRGVGRDRVARTLEAFTDGFTLTDHRRAITAADLDAAAVREVLTSIYRPLRAEPVGPLRLTFGFDLLLFRRD
jgi:23S rRNA (guanine745-N1)-methyltransferase